MGEDAIDPDRARRITQSITDEQGKARALVEVAKVVAATDPDRAERITQSITLPQIRVWLLLEIAKVRTVPTQN
jgi:hypothetical protein